MLSIIEIEPFRQQITVDCISRSLGEWAIAIWAEGVGCTELGRLEVQLHLRKMHNVSFTPHRYWCEAEVPESKFIVPSTGGGLSLGRLWSF